jgi:hypothetical protein
VGINLSAMNTRTAWRNGLFVLVILRVLMWWLFQHDIPRMHDHWQWQFFYSGDESFYFMRAQELVEGRFVKVLPNTIGVGLPFIMAGLFRFTGSTDYADIQPFMVIGNGLLSASVSVAVMATLAKQLTGSRVQGLVVGAIWAFLPYLLWLGFGLHPQADVLRNAYVSRQMWVSGITDSPSLFFVTLGMVLALRGAYINSAKGFSGPVLVVVGGVCMGFAAVIRIHVLPVLLLIPAALLWSRRWRASLLVVGAMLIGFMPQFWHNAMIDYSFINTPYLNGWIHVTKYGQLEFVGTAMPVSWGTLIGNIGGIVSRIPVFVLAGLIVALVAVLAFFRCWQRRGGALATIMFGAPLASFALHFVTFVYMTDPIRFTMPALALGLTAGVWTSFTLVDEILRLRSARSAYGRKVSEV